jgi:SAM-dependent methyltransferase
MPHDAPASALPHTQKQHTTTQSLKLNLGCGRNIMPGWVNVDRVALPGVDVVADLEAFESTDARTGKRALFMYLPFESNSVDEFLLSHVLEHITHTLPLMQELHRIAKPGAKMVIRVPHGASDDAWEDPTHVRPYFPGSFGYFSQPYYWRADYGYRGDWLTKRIELDGLRNEYGVNEEAVRWHRNVVTEMIAYLTAVKPIREPLRELQTQPEIVFV